VKRFTLGDALRGIAAIGVVAYHTRPPIPFVGANGLWPDFFFVLSGFVLAKYFDSRTSTLSYRGFVAKRLVRFYPLALVALASSLVIAFVLANTGTAGGWPTYLSAPSIFFAALLLQVFYAPSVFVMSPLWSLSAELLVNLVSLPLIRKFGLAAVWALLVIGTTMISIWIYLHPKGQPITDFAAVGRALAGFSIGILLTHIPSEKFASKFWRSTTFIVTALAVAGLLWLSGVAHNHLCIILAPFVFALVVRSAELVEPWFAKSKFQKLAAFLGTSSFGIYLWHAALRGIAYSAAHKLVPNNEPLMNTVFFVTLLSMTIVVARISYRFIEVPTMNWVNAKVYGSASKA
jgi:peptidoglycan/LPS O-acetylase OafA/YrhL